MIVEPEGYKAKGAVPRGIFVVAVVGIVVVASVLYWISAEEQPARAPEEVARAAIQDPQNLASQAKGNAAAIDELEKEARRKAEEERKRADAVREEQQRRMSPGQPAPLPPLHTGSPALSPGVPMPSEVEAGAAAREVAARTSASTVFDASDEARTSDRGAAAQRRPETLSMNAPERAASEIRQIEDGAASGGTAVQAMLDAVLKGSGPAEQHRSATARHREFERSAALGAGDRQSEVLTPVPAPEALMVRMGSVIPAVLTRRISSDLPGVVTARVSMDVYDSLTSSKLLIPRGAELIGEYNSEVDFGQERLQFAFTRLQMPDGSIYRLPGSPGADHAGMAGVGGEINRHFVRTFGSALLLGVIADRVTRISAIPQGGSQGSGGLSATGQVFVDVARAELERYKSTPVTIEIPEGTRLHVEVTRDMVFPSVYRRTSR